MKKREINRRNLFVPSKALRDYLHRARVGEEMDLTFSKTILLALGITIDLAFNVAFFLILLIRETSPFKQY